MKLDESMDCHRAPWRAIAVTFLGGLAVIALAVACLSAMGCSTDYVARGNGSNVLVAFDGRYGIAGGKDAFKVEIAEKNGETVYGPLTTPAGFFYVFDLKTKQSHSYKIGQPVPMYVAPLLTPALIVQFGITFNDTPSVIVPTPAPTPEP